MMDGWGSGGYGGGTSVVGGIFMLIIMVAVIVSVVLLVVWLVRQTSGPTVTGGTGGMAPRGDTPLDVLKSRYARGEIDTNEYEEKKKVLTG